LPKSWERYAHWVTGSHQDTKKAWPK
jgi:hypothetical protein